MPRLGTRGAVIERPAAEQQDAAEPFSCDAIRALPKCWFSVWVMVMASGKKIHQHSHTAHPTATSEPCLAGAPKSVTGHFLIKFHVPSRLALEKLGKLHPQLIICTGYQNIYMHRINISRVPNETICTHLSPLRFD